MVEKYNENNIDGIKFYIEDLLLSYEIKVQYNKAFVYWDNGESSVDYEIRAAVNNLNRNIWTPILQEDVW